MKQSNVEVSEIVRSIVRDKLALFASKNDLARSAGITQMTLYRWETGATKPHGSHLARLRAAKPGAEMPQGAEKRAQRGVDDLVREYDHATVLRHIDEHGLHETVVMRVLEALCPDARRRVLAWAADRFGSERAPTEPGPRERV